MDETARNAYLAGLIDGEGWVGIAKTGKFTPRGESKYQAGIYVYNTKVEIINWLREYTGVGSIRLSSRDDPRHKRGIIWSTSHRTALSVAHMALPYLVGKREQVQLIIEFVSLTTNPRGRGTPVEEIERQRRLYEQCRLLNARGRVSLCSQ